MAPGQGALRLTRVALFALVAVGLAGAAHVAGGEGISPLTALISVPAVMVVINLLASRRRGPGVLLVAMGLTQIGLHLAFMAGSIAHGCQVVGTQVMTSMPAFSVGAPSQSGPLVMRCGPGMAHHGVLGGLRPSLPMLLAHALATVLVVLVLAHGETALWALAACLGFRAVPVGRPLLPVVRRSPVALPVAFVPLSAVLRTAVRRRGPPLPVCAVP